MSLAVPDPWLVKGSWIRLVHALWGETWVQKPGLGTKVQFEDEERVRLDREQMARLDEIEENDRILIRGAAGTGKTLLAIEAALRQAEQGWKVLLVCFTNALGEWLSKSIVHPHVTAAAIRPFAVRLLGDKTPVTPGTVSSDYWNTVSLRAAMEGLPPEKDRWDAVVVDEGQDFSSEDWDLVEECARKTGRLWVFADETQAFWSDRKIPEDIENRSFSVRLKSHIAARQRSRISQTPMPDGATRTFNSSKKVSVRVSSAWSPVQSKKFQNRLGKRSTG